MKDADAVELFEDECHAFVVSSHDLRGPIGGREDLDVQQHLSGAPEKLRHPL